jgi:hypothetical protein
MYLVDTGENDLLDFLKPIPKPLIAEGIHSWCQIEYGHVYSECTTEGKNYWDPTGRLKDEDRLAPPTTLEEFALLYVKDPKVVLSWWEEFKFNFIVCRFGRNCNGDLPTTVFGWHSFHEDQLEQITTANNVNTFEHEFSLVQRKELMHEMDVWPIFQSSSGTVRPGGDTQAGNIDCPFCDKLVYFERDEIKEGDHCNFCRSVVIGFENTSIISAFKE